ncbi:MAG TPA: DUF72 domain-containing protein [Gemmatimonadales bacterium]|nr:DUF72 domain-containing protein [Gemmatimonadales bacterium]
MSRRGQPSLFDDRDALPAPQPELVELARGLPPTIRFGTSTWTYDGWAGDVYHRDYRGPQPAQRLEEYSRYPLFGTVGIDSAFYEPPTEDTLRAYAQALPPAFPCVSKVWDRITARRFNQDRRWGELAGKLNPDFLNADLFKDAVLLPYARAFRDHARCFVFEFQAMHGRDLPDPERWAEQLDDFLGQLPQDFGYGVELRNPELLHELHGEALRRNAVTHVFNSWAEMPSIGMQLDLPWTFPAGFTVARALLKPGRPYAEAVRLFEPYDRIREPQPALRGDLLRLMAEAVRRRIEALIVVNNRAEGNAPGTIRAVMEQWRRGHSAPAATASRSDPPSRG